MKIVKSLPQVDRGVQYLLRDGHGKITMDVKDKEMRDSHVMDMKEIEA